AQFIIGFHYEQGIKVNKDIQIAKHFYLSSAQQNYLDAQAAIGNILIAEHQYEEGLTWLTKAANMNNSRALLTLGVLSEYGKGIEKNEVKALEYYKAACELNNPVAHYFLGLHYRSGTLGLPQNFTEAGKHLIRSAKSGYPNAQRVLGTMYLNGLLLNSSNSNNNNEQEAEINRRKSEKMALLWFRRAASQGDVRSLGFVASCYQYGRGTTTNYEIALEYYRKASRIEDGNAHFWLAACYEEGIEGICACNLKIAYDHYLIAAKVGNTDAEFQIALMLSNGNGVSKDRKSAYGWYKKAAEKNHKTALYSLGLYHAKGLEDIPRDLLQARLLFGKSARLGYVPAMTIYAKFCRDAWSQSGSQQHQQQDLCQQAVHWYQKAALHGDIEAQRELGLMFYAGFCVTRNYETAFNYLQQAATGHDAQATLLLADCYFNGNGTEKNIPNATAWYLKAA
ncbi:hypothetical protein BJ944DRAFT_151826, partial [Cunninghamella echinulata]